MSDLKITKAKLTKYNTLEVVFTETINRQEGGTIDNEVTKKCKGLAHADLTKAFASLKPHLAILCEQTEAVDLKDLDSLSDESIAEAVTSYSVSSFSLGSNGEGITISGSKDLKSGKVLNLNSPHQEFDGTYDNEPYLSMAKDALLEEVEMYLNGKEAEAAQATLFTSTGNDNEDMQ